MVIVRRIVNEITFYYIYVAGRIFDALIASLDSLAVRYLRFMIGSNEIGVLIENGIMEGNVGYTCFQ